MTPHSVLTVGQGMVTDVATASDDDLIEELGRLIGRTWACDRLIRQAAGNRTVIDYWKSIQLKELESIEQIKTLLKR